MYKRIKPNGLLVWYKLVYDMNIDLYPCKDPPIDLTVWISCPTVP
jgi:hypothetical protein